MNPTPATRKPYGVKPWERLSAPVDPLDNVHIARAQSILSGPELGVCPPLTAEQARDVLNWHRPQH